MIKLYKKDNKDNNGNLLQTIVLYRALNLPSLRVGENTSLTAFLHQETTCINL
ncbi:hypothetical protein Hanom_Chr17g01568531 [Helianthus anomalus]